MITMPDIESTRWSVALSSTDYQEQAARSLSENGFCVIRGPVISQTARDHCLGAIWSRLDELLRAAHAKGLNVDGLLRFNELCKRQPGARYDLRLPLGPTTEHVPFAASEVLGSNSWCDLAKPAVDCIAKPVLQKAALGECKEWEANVAGCIVSLPGAPTQPSHTDGMGCEFVNAFLPLVDVTALNGPTEIEPGSQAQGHDPSKRLMPADPLAHLPNGIAPELAAGDLLLFQYSVIHRGCANNSEEGRPVLYFTYGAHGLVDTHNFPSDSPLL